MKNRILLAFIFFLTVSFSFSQNMAQGKDMKMAATKAVEYLDNGVKFTDKQKEACFSAFTEYGKNMVKVQQKQKMRQDKSVDSNKVSKIESRKYVNSHAMRFSKKRDESVKKILKTRQITKYEKLVSNIHPITLEVVAKSKKGTKSKK